MADTGVFFTLTKFLDRALFDFSGAAQLLDRDCFGFGNGLFLEGKRCSRVVGGWREVFGDRAGVLLHSVLG